MPAPWLHVLSCLSLPSSFIPGKTFNSDREFNSEHPENEEGRSHDSTLQSGASAKAISGSRPEGLLVSVGGPS